MFWQNGGLFYAEGTKYGSLCATIGNMCIVPMASDNISELFIPSIILFKIRDEKGRYLISPPRDKLGRFISVPDNHMTLCLTSEDSFLPKNVSEALVGSMLGDGSLRFSKKDLSGKRKPNINCSFAITLKNKEYIYHL